MNAIDDEDRPETSDLNKLLMVAGLLAALAVLIASFFWIMVWIRVHHLGQQAAMGASLVYVVLVLAITSLFNRMWRALAGCHWTPALVRRNRRTMASGAVYAFLLIAVAWVQKIHPVHGLLAYGLALAPAIPVLGMVASIGLYFREETDEFERAVRIENALWATGGTLAIATAWGFAEMLAQAPHAPGWVWFPVWAMFGEIANFFIRRRYR